MNKYITKSLYIEYLKCSKNAWLKFNKAEKLKSCFELSEEEKFRFNQGNEVDALAQAKFLCGVSLRDAQGCLSNQELAIRTRKHIEQSSKEKSKTILFQPTFIFDKFLAHNDILVYESASDTWHLYEVKDANSVKEDAEKDHIEDASFQTIVLEENGFKISKIFITHLNGEYTRRESLDINLLFKDEDITEKVRSRECDTRQKMQHAKAGLFEADELALSCKCIYLGRSRHCETFSYSHRYIPAYSIHDIARIGTSKKRLAELVDRKIFDIKSIPEDFELSDIQQNQIAVYKNQKPFIDNESIKAELKKLEYPLYFLDYESCAASIPLFEGFKPYQQIPFQFSLHVLTDANSQLEHFEFLHEVNSDPSGLIIQKLRSLIGVSGSIIAWSKSFEQGIHKGLIERHPDHEAFFQNLHNRFYDLEEIFKKQHYVDAKFRGKTSIKYVLPALVPERSYDELAIQDGKTASEKWFSMVNTNVAEVERDKIINDLKEYCSFDTKAMYEIWQFLNELK